MSRGDAIASFFVGFRPSGGMECEEDGLVDGKRHWEQDVGDVEVDRKRLS